MSTEAFRSRGRPDCRIAIIVVAFGLSLPAQTPSVRDPAQASSPPSYRLQVNSRIVLLDIVVTDKQGQPIQRNDLTRDDFVIFENGERQTIRSFEPPSAHAMPTGAAAVVHSAADLPKIGQAPVTILVLDELNSAFGDMSFARQEVVKYLQAQPPVLLQPTALMAAENANFTQLHDYTQNRDDLISSVMKHVPEVPWRATGDHGGSGSERLAQTLATLQLLAQSSQGTPGRKNLIWVGNGIPTVDLIGMPDAQVAIFEDAVRSVTAKLLASRVTVYTIDPTIASDSIDYLDSPSALSAGAAPRISKGPFSSGTIRFSDFAFSTGGKPYQGRNDLDQVLAAGIAQGNGYYTLSYSPTDKSDDPAKYRAIRVVMKDPDLRATTREGYFVDTAEDMNPLADQSLSLKDKQRALELDLSQALSTRLAFNGLTITTETTTPGIYTLRVADKNITWSTPGPDGSEHAEATVAAAWYDRKGKMLGHEIREEMAPRQSKPGAAYQLTLPEASAKAPRIRFVVRDALGGQIGTVDIIQ